MANYREAKLPVGNHTDQLMTSWHLPDHMVLHCINERFYTVFYFMKIITPPDKPAYSALRKLQTCQPLIQENLETHDKKSGDSIKSSEILFFPDQDSTDPFCIKESH